MVLEAAAASRFHPAPGAGLRLIAALAFTGTQGPLSRPASPGAARATCRIWGAVTGRTAAAGDGTPPRPAGKYRSMAHHGEVAPLTVLQPGEQKPG